MFINTVKRVDLLSLLFLAFRCFEYRLGVDNTLRTKKFERIVKDGLHLLVRVSRRLFVSMRSSSIVGYRNRKRIGIILE